MLNLYEGIEITPPSVPGASAHENRWWIMADSPEQAKQLWLTLFQDLYGGATELCAWVRDAPVRQLTEDEARTIVLSTEQVDPTTQASLKTTAWEVLRGAPSAGPTYPNVLSCSDWEADASPLVGGR